MKVILMCAMSVDGKIARSEEDQIDWTGTEDKKAFAQATKKAGVVIMGNNTFKSLGRPLKERLNVVMTSNLSDKPEVEGVRFVSDTPQQVLHNLEKIGYGEVFVIGGGKINSLFWDAGLINELWLTIAPRIFRHGISLFAGEAETERRLSLMGVDNLTPDLLVLKYRVYIPE